MKTDQPAAALAGAVATMGQACRAYASAIDADACGQADVDSVRDVKAAAVEIVRQLSPTIRDAPPVMGVTPLAA